MDNNKSHLKTDVKSNAELRKMYPKDGAKIGMKNGEKMGVHSVGKKYTKRSKLSHNN